MNIQEIKKMSRIERLQAMEALWDSLLDEETEIESLSNTLAAESE